MSDFYGEYNVSMDAKGRLMLPADFRKKLQESDMTTFTLKRGKNKCIMLYTRSQWEQLSKRLNEMNSLNPKVQDFKRLFLDGIAMIEPDSAGRILIPKSLQEHAGLNKDLVFWLQGDYVEIWDKQKKESYLDAMRDDLEALSNELFKDI